MSIWLNGDGTFGRMVNEDGIPLGFPPLLLLGARPSNVTPPQLTGANSYIGTTFTYVPGVWADALTVVATLVRDGDDVMTLVPGQTYSASATDLLRGLVVIETAANGQYEASVPSNSWHITEAPPTLSAIPDVSYTQNTGSKTIEVGTLYATGSGLTFSATGLGAVIDPATGTLVISTALASAATPITVTVVNSSGTPAVRSFSLTITASGSDPVVTLPKIALADIDLTIRADDTGDTGSGVPAGFGTWHFLLLNPPPGLTRLAWRGDPHVAGQGLGSGYFPCVPHPTIPNMWIARAITSATDATPLVKRFLYANDPAVGSTANVIGQSKTHHLIYTTDSLGTPALSANWSAPTDPLAQVLQMYIPPTEPGAAAQARIVPFAMKEEYDAAISRGYVPGCGMQQVTAASQCKAVPSVVWLSGDSHAVWRVADFGLPGGPTFRRPLLKGLPTLHTEGIAADPVDPDRALVYAGGFYTPDYDGLYLTTNKGDDWVRVWDGGGLDSNTGEFSAIAYDPATSGASMRWIAILPSSASSTVAFIRSFDRGATWATAGTWPTANGKPKHAVGIPGTPDAFFVISSNGFYKVTNAFGTPVIARITVNPDAPSREPWGNIFVSGDGQTVQVSLTSQGVWRSTTGGASGSFSRRGSNVENTKGFTNPWNVNHIITSRGEASQSVSRPSWTTNGGTNWTKTPIENVERRPGSTEAPWMCSGRDHVLFYPSGGHVLYIGRQVGLHVGNNHYYSNNSGASYVIANAGYNGTNSKVFTPSLCIFSSRDKNKCLNPIYDAGGQLTLSGFKWYERTQSGYSAVTAKAAAVVAAGAVSGLSTIGCAVHPTQNVLLEVTTNYANNAAMIRSDNNGVSWSRIPTLAGVLRKCGGIFYNFSAPGNVMWANYRSTGGDWSAWSAMAGLTSSEVVVGMTTNQSGQNWFFSCDAHGGTGRVFKRSGDNGATWTTVLTLTYDCRASGSAAFYAHPSDPNIVFVRDSTRYRIRNCNLSAGTYTILNLFGASGATPPPVSATAPALGALPMDIGFIAVDARFPDVMYATIGNNGYGRDNLWRSTNGGATWTSLCPIVGYFAKSSMYVHPLTGDVLIGGDKGSHILPPPYSQPDALFHGLPYESYVGLAA